METARSITGYSEYLVSDEGNVYSLKSGEKRRLKLYRRDDEYIEVTLYNNGQPKNFLVHRLVLEMFVGPCPEGMECCHFDGNKMNNHLSNLRWDTPLANTADQIRHGTAHHVMTEKCSQAAADAHRGKKLSEEHLAKMSKALRGKPKSEDWKAKARASWTPERKAAHAERMKSLWLQRRGVE